MSSGHSALCPYSSKTDLRVYGLAELIPLNQRLSDPVGQLSAHSPSTGVVM